MQTSAAISRSAAAALTDGGTAKDRHALPSAATKRFDAILHVIEIVLRDMANADPATRVALARLTEALARIVDFPPQPQESLRDFTRRLAAHMDVLSTAARALLEKQLNQQPLLAALKMLVETLRPALTLDLRIDLPLTRDGFWHPDPVSALFPDEDNQPVFRQPTIQAPLPTRMAFSQAPGVAPGAPHLQQALGQAFSPETTLQAPDAPAPAPAPAPQTNPTADASNPVGNLLQTADEPVPALREAAAFLASDAQALAQAVAIARGHEGDALLDLITDHPPVGEHLTDMDVPTSGIETGEPGAPDIAQDEAADAPSRSFAMPEDMPERPAHLAPERRAPMAVVATAAGLKPATGDQLHPVKSSALLPATSATGDVTSEHKVTVLATSGVTAASTGQQMPIRAEDVSAPLKPDEAVTGQHMAAQRWISQADVSITQSIAASTLPATSLQQARAAAQHIAEPPSHASGHPNPTQAVGSPQVQPQLSSGRPDPSLPASASQAFSEPHHTAGGATPLQTTQTAPAAPPPVRTGEAAGTTVPASATTASRLAPQPADGETLLPGLRRIEETITFRARPMASDLPAGRVQQQGASPVPSPPVEDSPKPSALPERDGQRLRHPAASLDADRNRSPQSSTDSIAPGLDHLAPKVEIALITTGVHEVANTIGQLDEWETLFYMLSGSLGESSEAPSPSDAHRLPDNQQDAASPRPPGSRSVESDLLTVIDEDRPAQARVPHVPVEDAIPASLLPRGMEAIIAREAIGYAFAPYLPVTDSGSVDVEEEEPRRQRRENEAELSGGEDESGRRGSGSSSKHDEASPAEPASDEDGERHDAYDLYQRLSDLA
ncbi:hypothetical protein [Rhizobium sp. 9140]|uniref:hypothetical protein n=1 Tax=Rhizobium sp. 9140 TaxID=1761900 RepID=UPI00079811C5|nr:hypothetical protein [Rhizobium sp. 9140]CZT33870.1 hypothetical protein GA0004734_00008920 [Rhizobium sp. 9140]